jgi:rod shape-determining protein MreC
VRIELRRWLRWRWLRFVAAFGAVFVLLSVPSRFTAPYRVLFSSSVRPVRRAAYSGSGDALGLLGTVGYGFGLADRNRALELRVRSLENRVLALQERLKSAAVAGESEALLGELPGIRPVRGHVIGYDAAGPRRAIQVDAGSASGVRAGQAAVFAGALVGTVRELSGRESRVVLLTDPASRVPCRLARTRVPCIAAGNGSGEPDLLWVKRGADVAVGDVVVTTRLSVEELEAPSRVPGGIPVGLVTSRGTSRANPLLMEIRMRPLVRLDRLETVELLVGR